MSENYLKAVVLILVFAAVVFAVERVLSVIVGRKLQSQAINQRLDLINRGVGRAETMQLLRRQVSSIPDFLPAMMAGPAASFEKMLMAAGIAIPTGRLMLMLLIAPLAIFLITVIMMVIAGAALDRKSVV